MWKTSRLVQVYLLCDSIALEADAPSTRQSELFVINSLFTLKVVGEDAAAVPGSLFPHYSSLVRNLHLLNRQSSFSALLVVFSFSVSILKKCEFLPLIKSQENACVIFLHYFQNAIIPHRIYVSFNKFCRPAAVALTLYCSKKFINSLHNIDLRPTETIGLRPTETYHTGS